MLPDWSMVILVVSTEVAASVAVEMTKEVGTLPVPIVPTALHSMLPISRKFAPSYPRNNNLPNISPVTTVVGAAIVPLALAKPTLALLESLLNCMDSMPRGLAVEVSLTVIEVNGAVSPMQTPVPGTTTNWLVFTAKLPVVVVATFKLVPAVGVIVTGPPVYAQLASVPPVPVFSVAPSVPDSVRLLVHVIDFGITPPDIDAPVALGVRTSPLSWPASKALKF